MRRLVPRWMKRLVPRRMRPWLVLHGPTLLAALVGLPILLVVLALFAQASTNDLSILTSPPPESAPNPDGATTLPSDSSQTSDTSVASSGDPTSETDPTTQSSDGSAAESLANDGSPDQPTTSQQQGQRSEFSGPPSTTVGADGSTTTTGDTGSTGSLDTDLTQPDDGTASTASTNTSTDSSSTDSSSTTDSDTTDEVAAGGATSGLDSDDATGTRTEGESGEFELGDGDGFQPSGQPIGSGPATEDGEGRSLTGPLSEVGNWGLVALGVVAAALLLGLVVRAIFGGRRSSDEGGDGNEVVIADLGPVVGTGEVARVGALDRLLRELQTEPEPRNAIRRAYAIVESGFGNPDLARRQSESASAYLRRTLGTVDGSAQLLGQLTVLFMLARYSNHPINEDMRLAAIDALVALRSRYHLAEDAEEVVPA